MAVLSRHESCQFTCYEVAHPWTSSCARSWLDVSASGFIVSLQVYTPLFLLARLVSRYSNNRRKQTWCQLLVSVARDSMQSSLFLATNCYFFVGSFCAVRWLMPCLSQRWSMLAAGTSASLLAILVERGSRRSALTVYMLNIASEAAANWLLARDLVPRVKHLRRVLAVTALATLFTLHRASSCDGVLESIARALLGTSEVVPVDSTSRESNRFQPTAGGRLLACTLALLGLHRRASTASTQTGTSQGAVGGCVCRHSDSCVKYALSGLMESMVLGVTAQMSLSAAGAAIAVARRLISIFRRGSGRVLFVYGRGLAVDGRGLVSLLRHFRLGLCLGLITSLFRALSCALRRWRGTDTFWHALPAGGIAATFGLAAFSSSSIELYLFWKVVDACCRLAARAIRPLLTESGRSSVNATEEVGVKSRDTRSAEPSSLDTFVSIVLYSAASGVVLAISALEPHHIRTSYWRFLQRLTDDHVTKLNRPLIRICCDTDSMKLPEVRRVRQRLEPEFISLANRVHLQRLGQL